MSPIRTTTPAAARRHEALYLRLAALTKQTAATAAHRPAAAVPEGVRILAEGLLFDIRPFATVRPRRDLPVAASDYGGLATQLGQALVTLDVFEARHTLWNGALKCFVWRVDAAQPLPVERLRPQTALPKSREKSVVEEIRRKVALRMQAKWDEAHEQGKRDAARDASALVPQTYPRAQNPG